MAARLLGLRVRIPLRVWMFISFECCVLLQVEGPLRRADHSPRGVVPSVSVSSYVIICNSNPLHVQWDR